MHKLCLSYRGCRLGMMRLFALKNMTHAHAERSSEILVIEPITTDADNLSSTGTICVGKPGRSNYNRCSTG